VVTRARRGVLAVVVATAACAPAAARPVGDAGGGGRWADSVLAALPLRDKVAQMVWPWVLGDYQAESDPGYQRTVRAIEQERVGGVIISIGSPVEVAAKLNALQRRAPLPLLVGADLEAGAAFRFRGGYAVPNGLDLGSATWFPAQMALGAADDTLLAYRQGYVTAREGRAVGVHYAFAPVLDVNNNPRNPVIGARAFSEDPAQVARLGVALIRGLHAGGLAATAKHFPGHGDTEQNSHLELARVAVSRARLDSVELPPFAAAIRAGVDAVMTFHGDVPALEPGRMAATLSPRVMTRLLREELGFDGLVVTDALDMNGVMGTVGLAEVCRRSVEAGADVLLMPSDLTGCIDAVVSAVRAGRIAEARIDASVRRLLAEKERLGLPARRTVDVEAVRAVVADTAHVAVAEQVAARALTLVKDSLAQVPLGAPRDARVLVVTVATRADLAAGPAFTAALRARYPRVRAELVLADLVSDATVAQGAAGYAARQFATDAPANLATVLRAADSSDVVVVASYVTIGSTTASSAAPRAVVELVQRLRTAGRAPVVVAFGNPYLLQEVPAVPAYLVAWSGAPAAQRAAARALLGQEAITGRLPVSMPPVAARGAGLRRPTP
jgi:beta-N-acetylhexosaminidase